MRDLDYKNLMKLYVESKDSIHEIPKEEESQEEEDKDHVIYIEYRDKVWEIDLNHQDHVNWRGLLKKIKEFLIANKNDNQMKYEFLHGLLHSEKLESYVQRFGLSVTTFLNQL